MIAAKKMEIFLVSGFLGAGKTTFIKHLLTSKFQGVGKVALIVNEVGNIGIDGTLLSGQNVDMIEIASGCICCTLKTDFEGIGDGVALIEIEGTLTKYRSSLFGTLGTIEIRRQIQNATRDPAVKAIVLRIDSPGGTVAATATPPPETAHPLPGRPGRW
ncbi:hypothetical protein LCGC14_2862260 [marine sediment metagenome]|uniref:CobW/HypB/UreG nucleotide-binding domain-containing protein n=1 Tax=marine sediment metagenome TaxID=412755 RepID=A0A0F9AWH2_9ZZZZ